MARSSEGILVGFPQTEDPGAIATRVTEHNAARADHLIQQHKSNIIRDERQGWDRQLMPYKLQQASDEQQERQRKLDEGADEVKRTSAARQEWEALVARFGTDNEPTGEEILIAHTNIGIANKNPAAASSAMNALATMRQGDAKGKALQSFVAKTAPLLGELNTPAGLEKLAKVLDDPAHRDALATPTYQDFQKLLFKQYEKVFPPEMAEGMQQYRLYVSQGMDRRKAWDRTLANRPELEAYIAKNGAPDEIKGLIKQEDIGDRQEDLLEKRKKADLERAVKVQEMRDKSAKDRLEYQQAARRGIVKLQAELKTHVVKNDIKTAVDAASKGLAAAQKEITNLTKQIDKTRDDDELETIQEKLKVQEGIRAYLQDSLGRLGEIAGQKAGMGAAPGAAAAAPGGGAPKATPTPEAKADKDLAPHEKAITEGLARAKKTQGAKYNHDAALRNAIKAAQKDGTITADQGLAIYRKLAVQ